LNKPAYGSERIKNYLPPRYIDTKDKFINLPFNRANLCELVAKIKSFTKYTNFAINVLKYEKFKKERIV